MLFNVGPTTTQELTDTVNYRMLHPHTINDDTLFYILYRTHTRTRPHSSICLSLRMDPKRVADLFAVSAARPQARLVAGTSRDPASVLPFLLLWSRTSPFRSSSSCPSSLPGLGVLVTLGTSEPAARGGVNRPDAASSKSLSTPSDDEAFVEARARRHCE